MPKPRAGEKESDYIGRCVKEVMGEGKDQQAALGQCYGMWRQAHGGKKPAAKTFDEIAKASWADAAREASDTARQAAGEADKKLFDATRVNMYPRSPKQTQRSASAMHYHETARDHYNSAAEHYEAGNFAEAEHSMSQGAHFTQMGDFESGRLGIPKAKLFCECVKDATVQSVHAQSSVNNPQYNQRRRRREFTTMTADDEEKQRRSVDKPSQELEPGDELTGDIVHQKGWSIPFRVTKALPEQQIIMGWASVVAKGDEYIVDHQGDIIPIDELENAVFNYMLDSRDHGFMHAVKGTGRLVMSFLTTPDVMKAFGLKQVDGLVGWIAGYKIDDPDLWDAHKRGLLPELSIGGSSMPFEAVDADETRPYTLAELKARGRRLARAPFRYK